MGVRTEAADGAINRLPQREQQADRRERLLSPAERAGVLLLRLSVREIVGLYLELQLLLFMIKQDLPVVPAVGKVILEDKPSPEGNV